MNPMNPLSDFVMLAFYAVVFLFLLWPLGVVTAIAGCCTVYFGIIEPPERFRDSIRVALLQLTVPMAALLWGTLWQRKVGAPQPPDWVLNVNAALLVAHVVTVVFLVFKHKRARPLLLAFSLTLLCLSVSSVLVSNGSISGDWP